MSDKIIPKNIMEDIIDSRIDELMESSNICRCRYCRADVWAYAANHLTPKYAVSIKGDVHSRYAMLSDQMKTDVTAAIIKGMDVVSQNPHHEN